jgi:NADH-quinone oxidoreductase subunit A
MYDYLSILIFLAVAGGFVVIFSEPPMSLRFDGPTVRRHQAMNGFDPFDDARSRFDVRFYLVVLLFLVMDLEILFCFPYSIALPDMLWLLEWNCFILLLTVGFIYEWS